MLTKERYYKLKDIFCDKNSSAEDFAFFKQEILDLLKEDYGEEPDQSNTSVWMLLILMVLTWESGYDKWFDWSIQESAEEKLLKNKE